MKKLLLLAAGALLATSASATKWVVAGAYTDPNWNLDASEVMVADGDTYTCTISSLINGFKIVDADSENWATQYGGPTNIAIGKTYVLTGKNGGDDPANMAFEGLIQEVKNAQISWNPTTEEMTINASANNIIKGYPVLYMTGGFSSWDDPATGNSVLGTETNGIYTFKVDLGNGGGEFKLAGPGWSNEIAGREKDVVIGNTAVNVSLGGSNLKYELTGQQTLTFNYNTMLMTFGSADQANVMDLRVVGAYTYDGTEGSSWNFEKSTQLKGSSSILSCKIDYLTSAFKIVDVYSNNWDVAYGYSSAITINQTYTLARGADNIEFQDLIQGVANATVNFNTETFEMTIVADEDDLVIAYPTLYLTGSFNEWISPGDEGTIEGKETDGVYTFTVDLGEEEGTTFKLASTGWGTEVGGVGPKADPQTNLVSTAVLKVQLNGTDLITNLTGEQTLMFDYNAMEMWFVDENNPQNPENPGGGTNPPGGGSDKPGTTPEPDEGGDNPTDSVSSLNGENGSEVIFNLQGVRVDRNKMQKGIYIIDGKKVMVK